MENEDIKNSRKVDIKQLEENFLEQVSLIWGEKREDVIAGILMDADDSDDPAKAQGVQEDHNSGHALMFLNIAVHAILRGQPHLTTAEKSKRILAHLVCLREFIPDEQVRKRKIIERLMEAILTEKPADFASWTHFLFHNWFLVRSFAEEYDEHEKCFPNEYYLKIKDILFGRI